MGDDFIKVPSTLIPLSVLSFDIEPSAAGWAADLAARGIEVVEDDIGRPSVRRSIARQLLTERREALRRHHEMAERAAAEAEKQRVASLWPGIPADQIPAGMTAAMAMVAAGGDDRPRRRSVVEDAFSGERHGCAFASCG